MSKQFQISNSKYIWKRRWVSHLQSNRKSAFRLYGFSKEFAADFLLATRNQSLLYKQRLASVLSKCGYKAAQKQTGPRVVLVIIGLLMFIFAQSANAQELQRTYTVINPSIFHELNPGEKTEGTTKVINESNVPLTFEISVQDYIVSDTKGTPNLLPPNTLSSKYSGAAWIGVTPSTFTLSPGQKQTLNYYIQVPPNGSPGGHYAAIVYAPVNKDAQDTTGGVVNTQIGSIFYLTVKGDIKEQASVTRFLTDALHEYGPVKIFTQIKNMGDLHISPKGTVTVTGLFFNEKQELPKYNIFPETARDFENTFGKNFMLGRYKASFIASFGQNNNLPLTAVFYFWVFPWRLAIVVVLIIVAIILGIMYWRKKKGTQKKTEPNTEGTQIEQTTEESKTP